MESPLGQTAFFLLILLTAALGACNSSPVTRVCTQIGCTSGIEVQLEEEPDIPYRVEADPGGGRARYVFECEDSGGCPGIFFAAFTPDWVTFEVITEVDTTWYEVRPEYTEHQPNGPRCEPICSISVVRLPSDALTSGGP